MRHQTIDDLLDTVLLGAAVSRFRWYRRWQGGHWERWYIEACHSDLWFSLDMCSVGTIWRPGTGRGTPTCEEWP